MSHAFGSALLDLSTTANDNPPCTPPVTDGQRVIAWFGSAGVYCYDLDGTELWHRELGEQSHQWGYASSLALYHDLCFLNFGPGFELLGVNSIGAETMNSSLAVSDGEIFIRTEKSLWCVGSRPWDRSL